MRYQSSKLPWIRDPKLELGKTNQNINLQNTKVSNQKYKISFQVQKIPNTKCIYFQNKLKIQTSNSAEMSKTRLSCFRI